MRRESTPDCHGRQRLQPAVDVQLHDAHEEQGERAACASSHRPSTCKVEPAADGASNTRTHLQHNRIIGGVRVMTQTREESFDHCSNSEIAEMMGTPCTAKARRLDTRCGRKLGRDVPQCCWSSGRSEVQRSQTQRTNKNTNQKRYLAQRFAELYPRAWTLVERLLLGLCTVGRRQIYDA